MAAGVGPALSVSLTVLRVSRWLLLYIHSCMALVQDFRWFSMMVFSLVLLWLIRSWDEASTVFVFSIILTRRNSKCFLNIVYRNLSSNGLYICQCSFLYLYTYVHRCMYTCYIYTFYMITCIHMSICVHIFVFAYVYSCMLLLFFDAFIFPFWAWSSYIFVSEDFQHSNRSCVKSTFLSLQKWSRSLRFSATTEVFVGNKMWEGMPLKVIATQ